MAMSNKHRLSPASVPSASFAGRMMLFVASIVLASSILLIAQPSDANRQFKRVFCNFDGCHSKRAAVYPRLSLAELVTRALRPEVGETRQPEVDVSSFPTLDDYEDLRSSFPSLKKTSVTVDGPETSYKEPEMERLVQQILPASSNRG